MADVGARVLVPWSSISRRLFAPISGKLQFGGLQVHLNGGMIYQLLKPRSFQFGSG